MNVSDHDLLQVIMEYDMACDEVDLRLYSRHFQEWRGGIKFRPSEAPPEQEAINITLAAFGPLFRAYANMPFGVGVLTPLLAATMDRLLPELYRRLIETNSYYRGTGRRLVRAHPEIHNAFIQGTVARQHMDRVEAAFRSARESGDLVSLEHGRVVRRPAEPEVFLDPSDFRRGLANTTQIFRQAVVARERLAGEVHAWIADDLQASLEHTLFFGDAPRVQRTPYREAMGRARETLVHCLNEVQRAEFERSGSFSVAAQDGKIYKVIEEDNFNVIGPDGWRYCCVPAENLVVYDKMLASKLWLEAEFDRFMRVANKINRYGQLTYGREEPQSRHRAPAAFDIRLFGPAA